MAMIGFGAHAMPLGIGLERRQVDDGQIGNEARELGAIGPDQQLADEQRVPGKLAIDARLDPIGRIGAAIEILREQLLAARMRDEVVEQQLELLLRELVVAAPPNGIFGERVDDDEFVLRAAPGMHAGVGGQRPAGGELRFTARDGVFVERGLGQIPMNGGEIFEAEFVRAIGAISGTRLLH